MSPVAEPPGLAAVRARARRGELAAAEAGARELHAAQPPESPGRGATAHLLGGIAFETGRLAEAEECFEEALRVAHAQEDLGLAARATTNLASIAHLHGKDTLALGLYRSALSVWEREGHDVGIAQAAHNLALLHRQAGRPDLARPFAERAVRAATRAGNASLEGVARMGLVELLLADGSFVSAAAELARARRVATAASDAIGVAEACRLDGLLALADGRTALALRHAVQGRRRALRAGAAHCAAECAELAFKASRRLRRERRARAYYQAAEAAYLRMAALPAVRRLEACAAP